ncbi:hypothetical protein SAMN05216462_0935 [Xylanibacter ruminicola]|uniref:Fimbrillin-like n=2 Tax=Xylanibacter ruminicola TaxID=839 RepID=A0A1H3ZV10_XYLRU|nr:hypothetical protein SAMN05216462_0935 [Xylanibacter ruminicola]
MKSNRLRITQLLLLFGFTLLASSCRETIGKLFSDEMEAGDEVNFTAIVQERTAATRTTETQVASVAYEFAIGMYKKVDTSVTQVGDDGIYTVGEDGGLLEAKANTTPLYWPDNTTAYGFKAVAGTDKIEADQSTKANWLKQDRLEGGTSVYLTNQGWKSATGSTIIPLKVSHTRSLITIILKAGEGVSRKALDYEVAENDLSANIYSYTTDTNGNLVTLEINPLAATTTVDYTADDDGEAETDVSSTRYDAIVEPYEYATNSSNLITKISLSGQKYSFYAQNDKNFTTNETRYNLAAGQHLTITVTLGRDGRKTLMTAKLEDWTEEVTTTICDDNGNAGEPIEINNRDELIAFLSDNNKNKAGNVALVTASFDLDVPSTDNKGDWSAYNKYDLNCTLNLGHKTLTGNHRFLSKIANAGSLLNGTIQIGGTVDAAIATENNGTINDVQITATTGATDAYATVAGVVIDNNTGTISKCSSALKVVGTDATYVGGIAAQSITSTSKASVIDGCTVTNRVSSSGSTAVGGIVGRANGYVTNNTFEYGITLLQGSNHQNIVGEKNTDHTSTFTGNAWPTTATNLEMTNAYLNPYNGIISTTDELKETIKSDYNQTGKRYRMSEDIAVSSTIGTATTPVAYELNGNGKQISTTAMIFKAITGKVHDLKILLNGSLTVTQQTGGTDAIAALAEEVYGTDAVISNVSVDMADNTYEIKASNPAGLVVWLWGGATVSNCQVKANIVSQAPASMTEGYKLAGGIVSTVTKGTVTQCVFCSGSTLSSATNASVAYYGGIVGGIVWKDSDKEEVELTLTDCTSYVSVGTDNAKYGSVLGYSLNKGSEKNYTSRDCQGNWWPADSRAVGTCIGRDETVIGKRSSMSKQ